ncbi:MAG: MFS transporter [Deltaproteobacteria bacterium]|nr:MFS transporter [Deltaproteobacteria bacterium]
MNTARKRPVNYSNIIIASCFSIQAIGIGVYVSFGVFFNPLMSEFGWPRAVIPGASSIAFFISGIFAIYVGRLNDRIGPKIIMTVTAVFLGIGCMLMSALNSVWQLYLFFGLVFGMGFSSIDVIALTTVARCFPAKRGMIIGIVKVGTGAGQLVIPLLASWLIAGYGWRNAYLVLGAASLILLFAVAQLLKRDTGELPHNLKSKNPTSGLPPTGPNLSFSQAAKTRQLWMICTINLMILSGLMSVIVHVVAYGRDMGVSAHKAAGVLSTIGGVSMVGRFMTGMIIDRIGCKRSMVVSLWILLAGLFWLQSADMPWKLYIFACIYGLAHGGFFTVISPIVAELFGIVSHGALFGLVVFFGTTGGAIGPIITGYLFDISGSYHLPFRLILLFSAFGLALLFFLKPVNQRGVAS